MLLIRRRNAIYGCSRASGARMWSMTWQLVGMCLLRVARVADFMQYFEERFTLDRMGRAAQIMAIASAHHRFNYIHPFPDGNGRVSRLMSHAMAAVAGIGARGLWSVSRGLARGFGKSHRLQANDGLRRYTSAGRSRRPRKSIAAARFRSLYSGSVKVCLDQVTFMSGLFELDNLSRRLTAYVQQSSSLKPEAAGLLQEALIRGEFERGEIERITGLPERSARRVLNDVIGLGLLASDTPKGKVSLRFPAHALEDLFPRLYPQT